MFCDSYNQARRKTSTDEDYFDAKAYYENGTYGYRYKPANTYSSPNSEGYGYQTKNNSIKNGMYRINNRYPWLSSPSAESTNRVCSVNGGNGQLNNYYTTYASYVVCPIVSLPSDIQIQLTN